MKKPRVRKNKFFKIIKYEIYPFDILLTCGTTKQDIIDHIEKISGYPVIEEDKIHFDLPGNGKTIMLEGGQTVMWFKEFNPEYSFHIGTIAHEAFHAVHFLFSKMNIKLSFDSDEAFAYAIGYVAKKVFEELRYGKLPTRT